MADQIPQTLVATLIPPIRTHRIYLLCHARRESVPHCKYNIKMQSSDKQNILGDITAVNSVRLTAAIYRF